MQKYYFKYQKSKEIKYFNKIGVTKASKIDVKNIEIIQISKTFK